MPDHDAHAPTPDGQNERDWKAELPFLKWSKNGGAILALLPNRSLGYVVDPNAKLPQDVSAQVVGSAIPCDAPAVAEYCRAANEKIRFELSGAASKFLAESARVCDSADMRKASASRLLKFSQIQPEEREILADITRQKIEPATQSATRVVESSVFIGRKALKDADGVSFGQPSFRFTVKSLIGELEGQLPFSDAYVEQLNSIAGYEKTCLAAEADQGELTAEWIRKRAARLALDSNRSRDAVHNMELAEFADEITSARTVDRHVSQEEDQRPADRPLIQAGHEGWSREMSKTEAGRLLNGPGSDKGCRNYLDALLDGQHDVIDSRTAQKHRFCLAWVRSIEPTAVEKFRPK